MENKLITIATFFSITDAHFALVQLEDAGIEAVIFDENVGTLLNVTVGGIKVKIREEDRERALSVLNASRPS